MIAMAKEKNKVRENAGRKRNALPEAEAESKSAGASHLDFTPKKIERRLKRTASATTIKN